jgi:D-alanyl-D-alanine carboxypeptidase (penicillin-binding protein 5/6)
VSSQAQEQRAEVFPTPAEHLVIVDVGSGEILFEKAARTPMAPASMTKIMTASVVFERIKSGALSMDDKFVVSDDAWRRGGVKSGSSTMFLKPGSMVSVRDLLYGVIIQSGNDACIVLAEGIAGSEAAFAQMMNDQAEALGLTSAHFVNSTGWPDPAHKISAYDLAKLAEHTITTYPEFYRIYAEKDFTWNGIKQPNRNPLFLAGFEGADGLKTGHTKISKYGFVGSAVRTGTRRLFVVNGLASKAERRSESLRIMTAAFQQFSVYPLFKKDEKVGSAPVFMGKSEHVTLVTHDDISIGLHHSQRSKMNVQIKYMSPIPAPIKQGDKLGELIVSAPDVDDKSIPLYAGEDVARKSIFGRITASLLRKIRGE